MLVNNEVRAFCKGLLFHFTAYLWSNLSSILVMSVSMALLYLQPRSSQSFLILFQTFALREIKSSLTGKSGISSMTFMIAKVGTCRYISEYVVIKTFLMFVSVLFPAVSFHFASSISITFGLMRENIEGHSVSFPGSEEVAH